MFSLLGVALLLRIALITIELVAIVIGYYGNDSVIMKMLVWYFNEALLFSMFAISYLYNVHKKRAYSIRGSTARILISYLFVMSVFGLGFYWDLSASSTTATRIYIWLYAFAMFNGLSLAILCMTLFLRRLDATEKIKYYEAIGQGEEMTPDPVSVDKP